ncbi:site-2 protease family protein, partial [Mesorhizobium sp. M00.F.Ca.ET.186.01.1.1]
DGMSEKAAFALKTTLEYCVFINVGLFVFNLLPVPPLDGYKILRFLSPRRWDGAFYNFEIYGPWLLLLLIFIPGVSATIFGIPMGLMVMWVQEVAGSIISVFI